jgi:hypothetical protein
VDSPRPSRKGLRTISTVHRTKEHPEATPPAIALTAREVRNELYFIIAARCFAMAIEVSIGFGNFTVWWISKVTYGNHDATAS